MILVSACLAGVKCRYNGESFACEHVIDLISKGLAIPLCPEQLGGLPTPRENAEQKGEKVHTRSGLDVTQAYKQGAEEALRIAMLMGCKKAVLKSRSPSCGSGLIYDGKFSGELVKGEGIFTQLLKANHIEVVSEDDFSTDMNGHPHNSGIYTENTHY